VAKSTKAGKDAYPPSRTAGIERYQFKPGQSGNPGGRPRRKPISERYEYLAEVPLLEDVRLLLQLGPGSTYADAAAIQQFRAAIKGDTSAMREIRESIEGKATIRVADEDAPDEMRLHLTIPKVREIA